jgi:hypothetical protein
VAEGESLGIRLGKVGCWGSSVRQGPHSWVWSRGGAQVEGIEPSVEGQMGSASATISPHCGELAGLIGSWEATCG